MNRRDLLAALALSPLGMPVALGAAATARAPELKPSWTPLDNLRIYIPAGEGGGWDQTGRALGSAMSSAGLVQQVSYENKGGKGGLLGLSDFVERYNHDPSALLIGGMVMVGAIAMHKPPVDLRQVHPLARLTADYLVLAVAPNSPYQTMSQLTDVLRRRSASVVFVGGSAGGVDHMLAGMLVRQLRLDPAQLQYLPSASGKEALDLLTEGKAQIGISGYSEFKSAITSGRIKALAVSSRKSRNGIASLTEQGLPVELANWRGVFCPSGIDPQRQALLQELVKLSAETEVWKTTLQTNNWSASIALGKDFTDALGIEQGMAEAVTYMLKLKS